MYSSRRTHSVLSATAPCSRKTASTSARPIRSRGRRGAAPTRPSQHFASRCAPSSRWQALLTHAYQTETWAEANFKHILLTKVRHWPCSEAFLTARAGLPTSGPQVRCRAQVRTLAGTYPTMLPHARTARSAEGFATKRSHRPFWAALDPFMPITRSRCADSSGDGRLQI